MDDRTLKTYAYINISSYRVKTMKALKDCEVKTPTAIAADAELRLNHISKVLKELKEAAWQSQIKEIMAKKHLQF